MSQHSSVGKDEKLSTFYLKRNIYDDARKLDNNQLVWQL